MYTREQFLTDVAAEARALKEHATREERERLSIEKLDPNSRISCIYGLMCFGCESERAIELITKCCPRFFVNNNKHTYSLHDVQETANGSTCDLSTRINYGSIEHFSSIETYIFTEGNSNANLIAFLRDETKELVL